MSEFECSNNHLLSASIIVQGSCPICGARIVRMDGMSNKQLTAMDAQEDDRLEEEDDRLEEEEE